MKICYYFFNQKSKINLKKNKFIFIALYLTTTTKFLLLHKGKLKFYKKYKLKILQKVYIKILQKYKLKFLQILKRKIRNNSKKTTNFLIGK